MKPTIEKPIQNPNLPRLLTVGQAASCLGVSQRTVWRMLQAGNLTPIYIGKGSTRIRSSQLEEYIQQQERLPLAEAL